MDAVLEKLTLQDYMYLYETEGAFEYINGERLPIMPTKFGHSYLINKIFKLLLAFLATHAGGEAFVETAFVLPDEYDANWVKGSRVPDILLVNGEKIAQFKADHPDWYDLPLLVVPDLVVEVVSSNDVYSDVDDKVEIYLSDGVQMIWVVDPRRQKVTVYHGVERHSYGAEDTLSGGAVIAGFSLKVGAIFED